LQYPHWLILKLQTQADHSGLPVWKISCIQVTWADFCATFCWQPEASASCLKQPANYQPAFPVIPGTIIIQVVMLASGFRHRILPKKNLHNASCAGLFERL